MNLPKIVYLYIFMLAGCSALPEYVQPKDDNTASFILKGVNSTPKPLVLFFNEPQSCSQPLKWNVKHTPCPCEKNAPPLKIPSNREVMFSLWQGELAEKNMYASCNLFFSFVPTKGSEYILEFDHSEGLCKLNLMERTLGSQSFSTATERLSIKNKECKKLMHPQK